MPSKSPGFLNPIFKQEEHVCSVKFPHKKPISNTTFLRALFEAFGSLFSALAFSISFLEMPRSSAVSNTTANPISVAFDSNF